MGINNYMSIQSHIKLSRDSGGRLVLVAFRLGHSSSMKISYNFRCSIIIIITRFNSVTNLWCEILLLKMSKIIIHIYSVLPSSIQKCSCSGIPEIYWRVGFFFVLFFFEKSAWNLLLSTTRRLKMNITNYWIPIPKSR